MDNKTIGKKIRNYRLEKKITQQSLADLSGLARITIQGYESEKYAPKPDSLKKIADALGIPIELLNTSDNTQFNYASKFIRLSASALMEKSMFNTLLEYKNITLEELAKQSDVPLPEINLLLQDDYVLPDDYPIEPLLRISSVLGFDLITGKLSSNSVQSSSNVSAGIKELENEITSKNSSSLKGFAVLESQNSQDEAYSLMNDFKKLNTEGKKEALKQVNNLTKIDDYTN